MHLRITDAAKARALYNWVSHNIRYVGMYMNLSGFVPHGAEGILRNRYGDCKDHVALLQALLRVINIDSSPVLVNSGAAYELPPVASSATFNHAITYVPSLDLFLDSTAQFAPMGTLPPSVQGKPALVAATGQIKTIPASSAERDGTETTTHLTLALDGSVKGSSRSLMKGSAEVNSRHAQFSMANEDPVTISCRILAVERESGSGRITPNDPTNLNIPWVVEASFELDPLINLPGPSAFVVPVGIAPGSINLLARQTLRDDRQFPYRCQDETHSQTTYITLPPDVTVDRLPEDVAFEAEGLQYRASYKQTGSTIQVQRYYSAQRGKSVCSAQDEVARSQLLKALRRDLRAQVFLR